MRPIDADRLIKCFCAHCTSMGEDGVCEEGGDCFDIKIIEHTPTIKIEPMWKPASTPPQKGGKYLTLWAFTKNSEALYRILNYGIFEDWDDDFKQKTGWWEFDDECGVCDYTEKVLYWIPLPETPKEE